MIQITFYFVTRITLLYGGIIVVNYKSIPILGGDIRNIYILAVLLLSLGFTQDRSVTISGNCLLENETDHSVTAVHFASVSGSAATNSVTTDGNGDFSAGMPEGIYIVTFSHDGFIPVTLPGELNFFTDTELEYLTLVAGSDQEVSGTLSGNQHWTNNFQYRITDDLTLNSGDTLIIDPGIDILFMGQYEFMIKGVLYAMGTESDSIRFSSGQPSKNRGDWKYLQFNNNGADGSYLNYTVVEYGGGEESDDNYGNIMMSNAAEIVINHSHIHSSGHSPVPPPPCLPQTVLPDDPRQPRKGRRT